MSQPISADFPYPSQFLEVKGSQMHYVEDGAGDPVLFLHGNPTSSYLWRNIMPYLAPHARVIAPDLIGMGKSDKPDLDYRFTTHYAYLEEFIEKMDLRNITLVIHDWGSGLGFHYASQHPDNIKGIAFMEAIYRPVKWSEFPGGFKTGFQLMRTPYVGYFMISVMNVFVNNILPSAIVRKLTPAEKQFYRSPYPDAKSRKPVRQWPLEIPIEGQPADMHEIVSRYFRWLQETPVPKLLFHGDPGGLIPQKAAEWIGQNLPNIRKVDIGPGLHYLQEDNPHLIGEELAKWYAEINGA